MNSSFKKLFAGVSAAAIALTQVGTVLAAYSDVPAGVWYEAAVQSFTDDGYLDASQTRFRGNDNANRAEFTKLVVELNGGILSTPPAVPSFDDVRPGAWYYSYMEEAGKEGWVKGDNNCYGSKPCYARPAANINRAEAAALIVRAFNLDSTGDAPEFVDVPSGQWYTDAVQTAADHCVLQGDDATGRARPSDFMNRAEMVVMLHRVDQGLTYGVDCSMEGPSAEPMITDVVATDASTVEVEFNVDISEDTDASQFMVSGASDIDVESLDWINESTVELTLADTMEPGEDYTLTAEDIEAANGDTFSDSMDFEGYTDRVAGEGTLEVSLASSNPSGDTVPKGAVGVVMASLDLTADCADDVWIDEVTVLHEGFGDEADIDGLYLAMDGGRVSRKRTLDSQDQTATLRLSDPLMVEACETITLDIVADFATSATASAEHNVAVELPSDFQSNARDTEGTFPLRGNTFRVATVTSGTLTVEYRTVSPDEVEVGDEAVVVGKFQLSTNSVEDQTVYSMTLEQNGTASDGDLQNIHIARTDGTVLTNVVASTKGDFATLTFDPPFTILEGDKITLEVLADITGGASDTIIMHFEESSDVFAVGSLYGFGVNGQLYGSQVTLDTTPAADTVTIQAGELTIEIDGPTQQKFTRDDDDAVLANFKITTGGDSVDIRDFFIAIEGTTSTGAGLLNGGGNTSTDNIHEVLEDVTLRNTRTGQSISAVRLTGSSDFGTSAADCDPTTTGCTFQIYRFDDFEVDGSTTWELQVDFIDNGSTGTAHPRNGDKFRVHACTDVTDTTNTAVCTFGGLIAASNSYNLVAEGGSTGDDVTDVRPGGAAITGNFQRIATPELNVAVKAIGASDTAVKNSNNVNLLRFEARAGEAEDILFTQAIFNAESGSLLNGQDYTLWFDSDGDGVVDTIAQSGESSQNSNVTFDDLTGGGVLLPAEESVLFEVHADISSSLTGNDLQLRFATGASNYIEAEEADNGSSLTGLRLNSTCSSTCEIVVTTLRSKNYNLVNQGDIFVTLDSTPTRSRQLLAGTLGDTIFRLQFRAQNEDIDVTDLQLTSSGSNASSIDRLELYKDGATTSFATATVSGCGSDDVLSINPVGGGTIQTFCANMENGQLIVKDGENLDVLVKPRMKSDEQGALSGQDIQLWISGQNVSDNSTGSGAVRARGRESSSNLTANNADSSNTGEVFIGVDSNAANATIRSAINDVALSKITTIANANPDADNTNIPTGISPIGQFKFTAASNSNTLNGLNKATLSGVIFNVTASQVDLESGTFKFYNKANSDTKASCTVASGSISTTGSLVVSCPNLRTASTWSSGVGDTQLESGETSTFVLEVNIQNAKVGSTTSALQVSIQDFTTRSTNTYGPSASHIDWTDEDSGTVASGTTTSSRFQWVEYSDTVVRSTSYKS